MQLIWLGQPQCHDPSVVGPKAAHCSILKEKFNVPPGFCIPAICIEEKRSNNPLPILSDALKNAITESYHKLGESLGTTNPKVAVRSSAIDEDNPNASFAGQHDTFLNVIGESMLFDCIVKCWQSAKNEFASVYRKKHALNLQKIHIAVMIQALITADTSGVGFSINPISQNQNEILINGNYGLGKSIVDGAVNPDKYVVDKSNLSKVVNIEIRDKKTMTVLLDKGTEEKDVPRILRKKAVFNQQQLVELATLIKQLEILQGYPVDIEFAYKDDALYLLQCRPISTIRKGQNR